MNIHLSLLVPFVYFCFCPGPPPKQRVHRVFVPKRGTNFAFMQYFYKLLSPLLWHHQLERVQREVFNLMVHFPSVFLCPHTFFKHFYFVYFLLFLLNQVLGLMANHLIIHMDYAENFHHLSQLQSQAEYFNMLQSSFFILMAYFINPNTGLLEVATFGFFTADLNKSSVS